MEMIQATIREQFIDFLNGGTHIYGVGWAMRDIHNPSNLLRENRDIRRKEERKPSQIGRSLFLHASLNSRTHAIS